MIEERTSNTHILLPAIVVLLVLLCRTLQAEEKNHVTLAGHTDNVSSVCFSPKGDTLASASWDRTIRIWDLKTWKTLRTLSGHGDRVRCVAFSPDGKMLASAASDASVKVWRASDGKEVRTLKHRDNVFAVAFSPDGKIIISGDTTPREKPDIVGKGKHFEFSGVLKFWDAETGDLLDAVACDSDEIHCIAIDSNGNYLAAGSWNDRINIVDLKTRKLVKTLKGSFTLASKITGIESIAFGRKGNRLYCARGKKLELWDVETGKMVGRRSFSVGVIKTFRSKIRLEKGHVSSVSLSPSGATLATAINQEDQIVFWDSELNRKEKSLAGHREPVYCMAFSPDGSLLASGSQDDTVKVWRLKNNAANQRINADK